MFSNLAYQIDHRLEMQLVLLQTPALLLQSLIFLQLSIHAIK
jgi:hypothetical protein